MSQPYPSTGDQVLDSVVRSGEMQPSQDEMASMLGQVYYLLKDDETFQLLREDPDMKNLMPMLSHLLRTSNLDKKTIEIAKLRWRIACRLVLLCQKEAVLVNVAKFNAWLVFGYAAIEDAKEGWRGRLVTEKIKTYKVETQAQRRGKFLGIF